MAEKCSAYSWQNMVRTAAEQCSLSHAVILCGDGKLSSAARYVAAAHLCTADDGRPCMKCNSCRKVMENIHPDVTEVQDPEHRYIAVDLIRHVRSDAYICPNEGARRVFLFPDCTLLTEQDQNVLLKIVEEGPPFAAFVFCTPTAHALLPTIRSRCIQWRVTGEETLSEEDTPSEQLCHAIARRNVTVLAECVVGWENRKPKREQLLRSLQSVWDASAAALSAHYGKSEKLTPAAQELYGALDVPALLRLTELCRKYQMDCDYNAGVGHVLGALLADLEEVITL